jgi:hypothetical protein
VNMKANGLRCLLTVSGGKIFAHDEWRGGDVSLFDLTSEEVSARRFPLITVPHFSALPRWKYLSELVQYHEYVLEPSSICLHSKESESHQLKTVSPSHCD